MTRYKYIGKPEFVTECEFLNDGANKDDMCNNGCCPGFVNGDCPFTGGDKLIEDYEEYFEIIEEE